MKKLLRSIFSIVTVFNLGLQLNAQSKPIRVACIGNSITDGGGGSIAYPAQLGVLLGNHYDVKNFGVSGTTLLKKGDFPYWNTAKYLDAKDFNPQIVIIKLGTNDSKPQNWTFKNEFYSDYLDLIKEFRKDGKHPQIYVCRPVPVFIDGSGITGSIVKNEIIPLVDSVRKVAGTYLIDFYAAMLGHSDLFSDGIHPTATGYTILAQTARDSILNSPSGIIRSFSSQYPTFEKDQSLKLYWETTTNSIVTLNGIIVNNIDSMVVSPTQSTTYTLVTNGVVKDTSNISVQYLLPGKIKLFSAASPFLDLGLGDSTLLSWSSTNGSSVTLDGVLVGMTGSKYFSPTATRTYKLVATGDVSDTNFVTVQVVESMKINRALNKTVTASSTIRGYYPQSAVDNDTTTNWLSDKPNTQWIMVDLGKFYTVKKVFLHWGNVFAKSYRIDFISDSGVSKVLFVNSSGDGGIDEKDSLIGNGRYFRLLCLNKSFADSGYDLKEFQIYGVPLIPTGVNIEAKTIPNEYLLYQNYPNPFNPSTTIRYCLSTSSYVHLKIYNLLGQEAGDLINAEQSAGQYEFKWKTDAASGLYFYRIDAVSISDSKQRFTQLKKMLKLK